MPKYHISHKGADKTVVGPNVRITVTKQITTDQALEVPGVSSEEPMPIRVRAVGPNAKVIVPGKRLQ